MARSLEQEETLLSSLAASSPRVAVDVVGHSTEGRPVRMVRIGDPEPPAATDRAAVLHIGAQHGDELAGREALLDWAEHLATTADSDEVAFLAAHGVLIIPTANPDGVAAGTRRTGDGTDLNRDHLALSAPESRAIAAVLAAARPAVVIDHHETTLGNNGGVDVSTGWPSHPMVDAGVVTSSQAIISAYVSRASAEGWTTGTWPSQAETGPDRLRSCGGLRLAATVLIETTGLGTNPQPEPVRVAQHRAMCEEVLAYAAAHDVIGEADAAAGRVAAAGAAGAPYDLGDVVLDPAPLGYQLSGMLPELHLSAFGIATVGTRVSMAQAAQPVIPLLFDADSLHMVARGLRLWTAPVPVVVPTVSELAPIVSASHRVRIEARVVTGLPTGLDPDGVEIPVLGGSVTWDGTADILGSVELTTVARWPRARERLLLPAGNEVFVRYGIDVGGSVGTLWTPLGYFRINRPSQDDVARGPITLSGEDRMSRILDARLLRPRQLSVGRTLGDIFAELVLEAMPEATIIFDDDTEFSTIARTLTTEESRYKVLRELADAAGKMLYWDGEGILRIVSPPDPAEPVWHLRAGPGGALISASREISREQVYNAVVARGEGSEMADPVEAVAYDDDPSSMTYFFGPFGMVPRFYQSPVISTEDQAYSAAVSMLRRSLGLPYEVAGEIAPNPALRPGHPVRFTWDDGNRELHVWETLELPLDGESAMSGTTQRQTVARVGRL